MQHPAGGLFSGRASPAGPAEARDGAALGRSLLDRTGFGPLDVHARGAMPSALTGTTGSAACVAIERVEGPRDGRRGTFCLAHRGRGARGEPSLEVASVPDFGTSELAGVAGELSIHIVEGQARPRVTLHPAALDLRGLRPRNVAPRDACRRSTADLPCSGQSPGTTPAMRMLLPALMLGLSFAAEAGAPLMRADDARLVIHETSKSSTPGAITVELLLGGRTAMLDLAPNHLLQSEAERFSPAIRRGEDRLFTGSIAGRAGTWARVSEVGGAWIGLVFDGKDLWYLEPARHQPALAAKLGVDAGATLVHRGDDLDLPHGFDPHGVEPSPAKGPYLPAIGPRAVAGSPVYLKLTLVLDTEFQAIYGANSASTAAAILNGVDGLYRAQSNIQISLFHLEALASNGTLTSTDPNVLLPAFRDFVRNSTVPFSGLAHLLSGKDFGGPGNNIIGLAYLGTACSRSSGYGINQATFSTAGTSVLVAHEVGHNMDAEHDPGGSICPASGFVMGASFDFGSLPTAFSPCSLDSFVAFLPVLPGSCINTPPDPVFRNGFEP